MKKSFFAWMITITIISLISTLILGLNIPILHITDFHFSCAKLKNTLYDISVGILSSMILVWCIDRIQEKYTDKENKRRRTILYNKLKNPLIKYYNFYLYLYIATRNSLVDKNNAVLESLYACKDDFFNQLLLTNPFYKSGCFLDIDVTKKLFDLLILHPENSEEIDKIMNEKTNLPWYKCWSKEGTEFYNSILQIERDFPTFFPNDLLEIIETLLNIIEPQKNMVDFVGGKAILDFLPIQNIHMPELPTNYILEAYNLEEILRLLDEIMSYIEKDSTLVLRHRDVDFFNNRNTCPQIGYSCDINNI